MLRGKFIALNAYIKKLEKSIEHLKTAEQKETNSPKRTRQQEIIKLRAEINKLETKKKYKESMRQRVSSSRKSKK